jgi:CO/xanthine dehydrogenase Mo-binding subunit
MLYARVLRSPHAHARVLQVHVGAALRLPGVHAVMTYQDVPQVRIDEDLLPLDPIVRYVGDEVAVVAAESEGLAEDALRLIRVDYEVRPAVFEAEAALQPEATTIHPQGNLVGGKALVVSRGDVTEGFTAAKRIFEGTFRTQVHAPAGMETRAALAAWEGGELTVWKTSRAVHANDRQVLSRVLGIPEDRIRVICTNMGGGFGNKDGSRLPVLTALLAQQTGRPVRLEYSRTEEFIAGRNRQSSVNHLRIGVAQDGAPTAVEMRSIMNAGAYVSTGIRVTRRTGQGPLYLYTCPHARYEGVTAYTNRSAGGSFRGLGAPLGHFALEVLIDQIAAALDMDPMDYRLRFHVTQDGQPGERTTPLDELMPDEPAEGGVPFSSNGLHECLLAGAERIGWRERRKPNGTATGPIRRGIGLAMGTYKGGVGRDAEAEVRLTPAGRVIVRIGNVDVGQGSTTLLAQIAAETLQVPHDVVDMVMADTAHTPPAHITAGSSTTITSGAAVKLAAEDARRHLLDYAEEQGRDVMSMITALPADIVGTGQVTSGSTNYIINTFMAHYAEVEVDMLSGRIRILRYVAAHDSGRIIHPRMAQNQVSGGVLQFLGIALREVLFVDEPSGVTLNPRFLEHKFSCIVDFPDIEV